MRLVFIGDLQFGRRDNICPPSLSPAIIRLLNNCDAIFFNLETVVINPAFDVDKHELNHKDIHIYTTGERHLQQLRRQAKKPTFVSTINNHTFDYGLEGYYQTLRLLDKHQYKFTVRKTYYIDKDFIYLNATDHWTVLRRNEKRYPGNSELWDRNCLLINNHAQAAYTCRLVRSLCNLKGNRKLVVSIHWGRNFQSGASGNETYLQSRHTRFFKKLCNLGADVVFGHGPHHVLHKPYEVYKGKLIIYGLGDLMGDFKHYEKYKTDESLCVIFDTDTSGVEAVEFGGVYDQGGERGGMGCKAPIML